MRGMSALTGAILAGTLHLQQSVSDILMTPLGSRVGRLDYGSGIPELVDAPLNGLTRIRIFAAGAEALARWEPRIRVQRLALAAGADGTATLSIDAIDLEAPTPAGASVNLFVPLRAA